MELHTVEDKIVPMYVGKKEDFHWVGFGSGKGTNLRECAKKIKPAFIFSDRENAELLALEELAGVPRIAKSGYNFCGSWKRAQGDPEAMAVYKARSIEYNKMIVEMLHDEERKNGFRFDLIVLGGYMRLIEAPLLEAYRDRIINVHPADLSILNFLINPNMEVDILRQMLQNLAANAGVEVTVTDKCDFPFRAVRRYVGDNAVYDAIKDKRQSTRSSVILVDEFVDHGEILTMGKELRVPYEGFEFPIGSSMEKLLSFASDQQDRQKRVSDWPALTTALELIAEGRLGLGTARSLFNEWRRVYLDGEPLPYSGIPMKS